MSGFEERVREYAESDERFEVEPPEYFFHNWLSQLPGGSRRRLVAQAGLGDERFEGYKQGKTFNEFIQEVDQALIKKGITPKDIELMMQEMSGLEDQGYNQQARLKKLQILEAAFPVFLALLESGYSDHDLRG